MSKNCYPQKASGYLHSLNKQTISHHTKSSVKRDELLPQQGNQISKSGREIVFLSFIIVGFLNGTENNKRILRNYSKSGLGNESLSLFNVSKYMK